MRKYLLCASLALIGLGTGSVAAQPASTPPVTQVDAAVSVPVVKYRKNIDTLTDAELAAYTHAVDMLKKKSAKYIYDRTGFLWQAWVHNCTSVDVFDSREASLSEADLTKLLANPGYVGKGSSFQV